MSDYGISVKRTAGKVQIDSTFKNYSIYDYGTATKAANAHYFNIALYENTMGYVCGDVPWIVFNLDDTDNDTIHPFVGTVQALTWQALHSAYTSARTVTGKAAFSIPWMVLTSPYKPREHYGLEIYNPAGESVFTSWEPYVEIVGVYDFNLGPGTASSFDYVTITVKDPVNNYFHITNNNYKWYHNWAIHATDEIHYYTMGMAKANNVSVEIGNGVPCGTVVWGDVPSYIAEACWTDASQLIEVAPVRGLV